MRRSDSIFVAGHRGLVGSALVRKLTSLGYTNIITRTRNELDLLHQASTERFFKEFHPAYVFCAAAKVGGIWANMTQKADFIYENLQLQNNIIHAAYTHKVKKLLFLGSSCVYPHKSLQPIKEQYLMAGSVEPTNDAYAIAKIAGIYMCKSYREQYGADFISVMPTNLYGPNDNFNLESSHVLPALIRKFHEAKLSGKKEVVLWGSGRARREFLHVDDMADACVFLMNTYQSGEIVNIGSGEDIAISRLAALIKKVVGYTGKVVWDREKPDGMKRKNLDIKKLSSLGWHPSIPLEEGIATTYEWFVSHYRGARK